ncbi:MAG TPA: VWA domain-containing protein [Bryobacteraceae bacterium]|nr:VWA domain-containing protein [Bryobacteraceae bacterium]
MKLAVWFSLAALCAQEPQFGVRARLVLVPTTVTDAIGRPVYNLATADFLLLDDQRERTIAVDTLDTGVAPIALVIAVQSSGISAPILEKVRKIGAMLQPLVTGERGCAALVTFAESVTWLQECTNDANALERAFRSIESGKYKKAIMLDAVSEAIERLRKRENTRRVVLLISESRDRSSQTTLENVIQAAESADVTIYAATYSLAKAAFTSQSRVGEPPPPPHAQTPSEAMKTPNGQPPTKYNPPILPTAQRASISSGIAELLRLHGANTTHALAVVTGGTAFPFTRQKGLEEAIGKLGAELHSQYILSFVPEGSAPGYHNLSVLVRGREYHIRARPGYWLPGESQ